MGLISIKATYKLKGLVNVSGFHVDPGWSGPLIFTVFNAGPATIHLQQGLPVFLLWIAALDEESEKFRTKPSETCIPPAIINNITGVVDTIYALEKRMKDDLKSLADKQEGFRDEVADVKERQNKVLLYLGIAAVVVGAVVGVGVKMIADRMFPAQPPVVTVQASAPPQPEALPPRPAQSATTTPANAVTQPDASRRDR
jgi:dCTP deaminase